MISTSEMDKTPTLRWYVAETDVHQERKAALHLREEGFEAYLPMRRAAPQARRICAAPFFPRYLFVRLAVGAPGWTEVFSTVGVKAVLGNARPLPLDDRLIEAIRGREQDGFIPLKASPRRKPDFERGQRVRVLAGPFAGFEAIFHEPVDARRVVILLSFLGRDSRVVADQSNLRAVS